MNIYFIILLIISIFSILEIVLKFDKTKKYVFLTVFFWLFVLLLIAFAGFRRVGADFTSYEVIFDVLQTDNSWLDWRVITLEPGFKFLIILLRSTSFQFSLIICALIAVFLKAKFIKKYSPYPILSLVIYFTSLYVIKEMGQIRHGIALGIILWSFDALARKNSKRFLLLTLLAVLFHWSAFCVLPLYFFGNRKIPSYVYIGVMFVIFFMILFNLTSFISTLMNLVPIDAIKGKADSYLSGDSAFAVRLGINSTFIFLIGIMSILLFFRKKMTEKFPYFDLILNIYILGIFYFGFFNAVSEFALRLNVYFRMIDIIILPMILTMFSMERIIIGVLLCINSFLTLSKYEQSPISKYFFPYKSILDED